MDFVTKYDGEIVKIWDIFLFPDVFKQFMFIYSWKKGKLNIENVPQEQTNVNSTVSLRQPVDPFKITAH